MLVPGDVISSCPDPLRHAVMLMPTTSGSLGLLSTLPESKRICQGVLGLEGVSLLAGTHSSFSSRHPFLES